MSSAVSSFDDDHVAHRRELDRAGVTPGRIRRAVASGRWQEPVPGVVVGHGGPLTQRQRWVVGLRHAGPLGCLSHRSALVVRGARIEEPPAAPRVAGVRGGYVDPAEGGLVEVSVPHGRHLRSSGFVVVHQSRRPLRPVVVSGLPVTRAARAAVDVAVTASSRQDVDHVVSHVLQRGLTGVEQLLEETEWLGRRATTWLRAAVADAARGMRSVGESELRPVVLAAGLSEPEWGAAVDTPMGTFHVDALWRAQGVAVEVDGAAFHLSAEDWARDLVRQNALLGTGLVLLRYPVRRLRSVPEVCGAEMRRVIGVAR